MICSSLALLSGEPAPLEVFEPQVPHPLLVSHPEAQPAAWVGESQRASQPRQPGAEAPPSVAARLALMRSRVRGMYRPATWIAQASTISGTIRVSKA